MHTRHLAGLAAAFVAALLPAATFAQASAPPAASAASTSPGLTGPRLLTPAEKRDNANAAAAPDLRPDHPVLPQIRIPLGRTPPPAAAGSAPARRASAAPAGHIRDTAARCESLPAGADRSDCRRPAAPPKPPA